MDREALILNLKPIVLWQVGRLLPLLPLHQRQLREDLVQIGWLGAIEAVEYHTGRNGASLQTYAVYRIRGALLDWLRKQQTPPMRQFDPDVSHWQSSVTFDNIQQRIEVEQRISSAHLSPLAWDALERFYFNGDTDAEIAASRGVAVSASSSIRLRALNKLRWFAKRLG